MFRSNYTNKAYENCYEDDEVFIFHLERFARIVSQFFVSLHRKRSKNLGVPDCDLPIEILPTGELKILQSNFRNLEECFRRSIVSNPATIYDVINRRSASLERLQKQLLEEERFVQDGIYGKSNPMEVFEAGTDFCSFYLEYYFPYDFFQNVLSKRLHYRDDEIERLTSSLMTSEYSSHLEYDKGMLEMALQRISGNQIDVRKFEREHAFLDNQDLKENRLKGHDNVVRHLDDYIIRGRGSSDIISELDYIELKKKSIKSQHEEAKKELYEKIMDAEANVKLIRGLADLLIDTGLENEENHYWRNRTFAYFRDLATGCGMNYRTVSIEELSQKVRSL